jgi:hypothetical protein
LKKSTRKDSSSRLPRNSARFSVRRS